MPPSEPGGGAIGMLAAALARLDQQPVPGGIRGVAGDIFAAIAPSCRCRSACRSQPVLFRPLVEAQLAKAQPPTR